MSISASTTQAPPRRARKSALLKYWPLYPAFLFLGFFFLYPVILRLGLSFVDNQGALTGEHYSRLVASSTYLKVLMITLKIAGWTTLIAILAGYPVA
ncbi:MAG TPA: ABC transporter permease, partial [Rhizobiales bacterium]|nr:ABC transporter permease [Hyphomicrobiales bacterium]